MWKEFKTQKQQRQVNLTIQAFITFLHQDSVEEARKKFNNQVFIRVKPYYNYHLVDKKANIFINNLSEDADDLELEQDFSRFSKVSIDVHRDKTGNKLHYGYIQFERKEEAENLIKRIQNHSFIYKGKLLKIELFKTKSERKVFAAPLAQLSSHRQKSCYEIYRIWIVIGDQRLLDKSLR